MKLKSLFLSPMIGPMLKVMAVLVLGAEVPSALALDLSALGAATVSNANFDPSVPSSSGMAWGAGATAGLSLSPYFSWESGILFLDHSFSMTSGTSGTSGATTTSVDLHHLEIPVLLRFNPIGLISFAGGVYYGIPLSSSVNTTVASGPAVPSSGTLSSDFGLMAGAGIRWPIAPLLKLRADVLYEYGLANLGTSGQSQYSRNLDILAGFMLDLW